MAAARQNWKAGQAGLDPTKLVFIDETGANTRMTRAHGRCAVGQRLICKTPWGHWKSTTFTCGLRCTGLVAPWVLDGPMNGDAFLVYVERVRQAIEAAGATLSYLPPYSPDLNPIELAFAKLKGLLRKAAERTVDDLWRRIGCLLDDFSPEECANYFRHDGYAST